MRCHTVKPLCTSSRGAYVENTGITGGFPWPWGVWQLNLANMTHLFVGRPQFALHPTTTLASILLVSFALLCVSSVNLFFVLLMLSARNYKRDLLVCCLASVLCFAFTFCQLVGRHRQRPAAHYTAGFLACFFHVRRHAG